jgi:hypothetical protein
MNQRLKSWESPRRQGRNEKGKGGAARRRQIKKQMNLLRRTLKGETITKQTKTNQTKANQTQELNVKQSKVKDKRKIKEKLKERIVNPFLFFVRIKNKEYVTNIQLFG